MVESAILRKRWIIFSDTVLLIDFLIMGSFIVLDFIWFSDVFKILVIILLSFIPILFLNYSLKTIVRKEYNFKKIENLSILILSLKILWLTFLVYVLGGIESAVLNIIYFIIFLEQSLVYSRKGLLCLYLVSIVSFMGMILLGHFNIFLPPFPPQFGKKVFQFSIIRSLISLTFSNGFFIAILMVGLNKFIKLEEFVLSIEEERSVLLDTVLHKIRNLLSTIKLMMAVKEYDRKKLNEMVDNIISVIEKFEMYSELESLEEGVCSRVDEIVESLKERYPELKIEREKNISYPLSCDVLSLVIENLVENAYFHGGKGVLVEVSFRDKEIVVKDNGKGIPPEMLKNIFKKFHKGTDSSGTGLGLYLVKKIITMSKGEIKVSSSPGKGTMFLIKFKE